MKKVRIMLAAVVVLGSVGGALALKAKTFGGGIYCTTTQGNVGSKCPLILRDASFGAGGTTPYRHVFIPNCDANTICTSIGISLQ